MCSKKSLWTTELDIIKIQLESCKASATIPSLHMEKPRFRVVQWLAKVQSWGGREVGLRYGTVTSTLSFLLPCLPSVQTPQGQEENNCQHSNKGGRDG